MIRSATACLLIVAATATAPPSAAQSGGLDALLALRGSPRTTAMGGAVAFERRSGFSRGRETDVLFLHPGALVGASGASIVVDRPADGETAVLLSAGRGWMNGTLGLGLRAIAGEEDAYAATIAYARTVAGLDAGIGMLLLAASGRSQSTTAVAFDVGLARDVGPVYLALSGRNLGPEMDRGAGKRALPWRVELGAASASAEVGPLDVVGAVSVRYGEDETWRAGGGLDVSWWPVIGRTFSGRIGLQEVPDGTRSALSMGLAFTGDALTIEYAWWPDRETSGGHHVGVSWR